MKLVIPKKASPILSTLGQPSLVAGIASENSLDLPPLHSCPALVLAGGLGTRLRAVYCGGPKCMAPVGGRPFLEYILRWLGAAGIRDLVLCVGYKGAQIQKWLGDGTSWGFRVSYSVEKELCGTAGALKLAAKMVTTETCIVLNGDSFLELDLREMCRVHQATKALVTIALARVRDPSRYGAVQLDPDGKIVAFHQKSEGEAKHATVRRGYHLINGGVYLLQRRLLDSIPPGEAVSLEKQTFPGLTGGGLYGFVSPGFFIDIGVPADYRKAQAELTQRFSL